MSAKGPDLYELLPAIHRIRDAEQGEPLRALLGVVAEQVSLLEDNLEQLYDDQFIETCADWVLPYIGDLIGYQPLHGVAPAISSPRAEVANTIRFRRRKGTASMLEQLARDVTGWSSRAVEFFEVLGWNQYAQHTRAARGGTLDLRDHDACELVLHAGGAFDRSAHNLDVRRIATGAGRYSLRNVGVFIWRLKAQQVLRADARKVAAGRYTFDPLGFDAPLFNFPQAEAEIEHIADESNVPGPLRRRVLHDELARRRSSQVVGKKSQGVYFGITPAFEIFVNREAKSVPPEAITICNLEQWHAPSAAAAEPAIRLAVDPLLGRIAFAEGEVVEQLRVNFAYGSADDLGGGPYDRVQVLAALRDRAATWEASVSKSVLAVAERNFTTLEAAVSDWNVQPAGTFGVLTILDSSSYVENLSGDARIQIRGGSRLVIAAQNGARPHLLGELAIVGTAVAGATNAGALSLNGLLLEGAVTVLPGNLGELTLGHCTLVPGQGELHVNASLEDGLQNAALRLAIERTVCGPIKSPDTELSLTIADSIVSSGVEGDAAEVAIDVPRSSLGIVRSTILGTTSISRLEARNVIFAGLVSAERRQVGCVGFSYLPTNSRAPRRHRCQPDLEITTQLARAEKQRPLTQPEREALTVTAARAMQPTFTANRYGLPAFAQLLLSAPPELRQGADDEAEMGAFHDLFQPQRDTNLRVRLEEYLRFGFEAGIVYVN